jgi:cell division protein ZapA (FtsZ GTPase activity inhibitor)
MSNTVRVSILGTEYPLRSNDEALTLELAGDVDTELKELQQKLPSQSTATLAVLTALNFAENEAHAKENERRELDRLTSEIDFLSTMLEDAMKAAK